MPRFAGQSPQTATEAKVEALEEARDEAKEEIKQLRTEVREVRESQQRIENTLKGALWVTGAFGSVLGAVLTFLTILGFRKVVP